MGRYWLLLTVNSLRPISLDQGRLSQLCGAVDLKAVISEAEAVVQVGPERVEGWHPVSAT